MNSNKDLNKEWTKKELGERDLDKTHLPWEVEYEFYNAVKTGNIDYVRENCEKEKFSDMRQAGTLSKSPLTNMRYHFVITTAMITRHCVEGGMELEQAYRLSDFYILKMDSLTTAEAIIDLHHTMALDFTGKMLLLQKHAILSKSIKLCTDYIYKHLHERITVDDLANYTQLSTSYLSRLFKKNLGISVSDYIREKKIDKATDLLKYSNYSYVEIANYLSFSSQSHFIQAFEKQVGLTPKKYRDRYYHSIK